MSRRFTCTVESDDALETIPSTASITPESSSAEKVEPRFMDIQVSIEKLASASGSSTRCEHCTRTFDNLNALHMHLVKTHNLMYSDADCRLFHRTPNSQRGVKHRYYCPIKQCRYNSGAQYFSAYKLLSQHYKKVHTKKTLRCSKCNMAFSLQRDLTYHVRRRCALRERSSTESTVESGRTKDAIPTQSRGVSRVDESHTVTPKVSTTVFVSPFVVFNIYRDALQHGSSTTSHILKNVDACTQTEGVWADIALNGYDLRSVAANASESCAPGSCHVSAQTSLPPIDSIAFQIYEQNDFHCQTSPLGGVEFGTQIYADETCYGEFDRFDDVRRMHDVPTYIPSSTLNSDANVAMQLPDLHANACRDMRSCADTIEERQFRHAETHVDELDFDEFLRHIETQTCDPFASDALTQTASDFIDSSCMTDWDTF